MNKSILILVVFLLTGFAVFAQQGQIIVDVEVNGLNNVDQSIKDEVYAITDPLKDTSYDVDIIGDATNNISLIGSFSRVTNSVTENEDGVIVSFNITENPSIRDIIFIGNQGLSSEELQAAISISPGDVLSERTVLAEAYAINALLRKNGFEFSSIINYEHRPTDTPNVSDLVFEIFEPTIGNVTISGNDRTDDTVIIDCIEFKTGSAFNVNDFIATQNNLAALGIFDNYMIFPKTGALPGTIDIEVLVLESQNED